AGCAGPEFGGTAAPGFFASARGWHQADASVVVPPGAHAGGSAQSHGRVALLPSRRCRRHRLGAGLHRWLHARHCALRGRFMSASPRVAMVAGETSGDLLAGLLIDGMQAHWPGLTSCGIGGPQMARRGFDAYWPSEKLAVHGYSMEVLRRLRELLGIRKQLRERLLKDR